MSLDLAELARVTSRQAETRHGLEPGALLGVAWLGAARAARRVDPRRGARPSSFVGQAARHACWDALRDGEEDGLRRGPKAKGVRWARGLADESTPPARGGDMAARHDAEVLLRRVIVRSSPRCAEALVLVAGAGLSTVEAARRLGVSQPAVSMLVARAMEAAQGAA